MPDLPINAVRPISFPDIRKISSLVNTGQTLETVDGRRFFVTAKVAVAGGPSFRLVTPTASQYVTARQLAEMDPLAPGLVRLAHVLRFYAFNKDFDLYIKDAIRAEGLPVDPTAHWDRFFQKIYRPMLADYMRSRGVKPDDEVIDEAIHATIIDALLSREGLSKFRPSSKGKGKQYTEGQARQVTKFLSNLFEYEKTRAKREILRLTNVVPSIGAGGSKNRGLAIPMERPKPGQPEETYNILDTEEFGTEHPTLERESWEDIARFRAAYAEWLKPRVGNEVIDDIMTLLGFMVQASQRSGGREADLSDYRELWMSETGNSLSYYQVVITKMADTLSEFVDEHPELVESYQLARLINDIGDKKPSTQHRIEGLKPAFASASLRLAMAAPSDLAAIPGDTGGLPHDNTGTTDGSVIVLEQQPEEQPRRTVAPEVPSIRHGA